MDDLTDEDIEEMYQLWLKTINELKGENACQSS
jgi:hypothetical protein